ncbi:uncharacterized protein LOC130630393 [Hydractinia symbiolongicarpus]|uniref:uncharacterized protein LOC130630393 n=1 Tax=Hydractinia symbiolongicarpus TaxID=13093 RepID=UPI0025514E53|nr:uncharacterized protein LOC130630393 [Hydractinia symbiolongicarpus]
MSVVDPLCCGFVKIGAYVILTKDTPLKKQDNENKKVYNGRVFKHKFNELKEKYSELVTGVDYNTFTRNFPKIVENVRGLAKRHTALRNKLLECFSLKAWLNLSVEKRKTHSLQNCLGCQESFKQFLALFPAKKNSFKIKAERSGLFREKEMKNRMTEAVNGLNDEFASRFESSFTSQFETMLLEKKESDKRCLLRTAKKDIEHQWAETSVERAYGVPISLRNRDKLRLHLSFESKIDAVKRTNDNVAKITQGLKRPHSHTGQLENFEWSKSECLEEINNYPEGHQINFSDLARRHKLVNSNGIQPQNCGQVLKELLINNGCNLTRFRNCVTANQLSTEFTKVRRKKRKLDIPNFKNMSFPVETTNKEVNEKLKDKITTGEYSLGDLIVPQSFTKAILKEDKIIHETVEVSGRKMPLTEIRKNMLEKHLPFMRLRSDKDYENMTQEELILNLKRINEFSEQMPSEEYVHTLKCFERRRHLMFWHDGSSIASHSHVLMLVACMYDPALFLTDDEYMKNTKTKINVQAVIEKPEFYILARCPATDQQLLYSNERCKDIIEMRKSVGHGITDVMRFFKGDSPAAAFEVGQQKGGNFFCHSCSVHADCVSSLVHTFKQQHLSLQDRVSHALSSVESCNKLKSGAVKLHNGLKKHELINELHQRKIKFSCDLPTKELNNLLQEEMHGIQRLPALMFGKSHRSLSELNLEGYEILNNEPLRDVSNYIKNIYCELPHHVGAKKKTLLEIIEASFNNKEAKNASDYRRSLLIVTNWALKNLEGHFALKLLISLSKIQEILYLPANRRSMPSILHLIIATHHHAMLIKLHIRGKLTSLTKRKFFGVYYHSIIRHSGTQLRLVSGRTANTEKEEASFNPIKTVTKLTSNNHPENIICNALIRMQAAIKLGAGQNAVSKDKSFEELSQRIQRHSTGRFYILPNVLSIFYVLTLYFVFFI